MKKIVFLSIIVLCLASVVQAQVVDDIYYVPVKKDKKTVVDNREKEQPSGRHTVVSVHSGEAPVTTVVAGDRGTTIVVKDRKGNVRDIDEYNRRYDARDNTFSMKNDTLIIEEKDASDPDGEWINGFDGTSADYEYATRIIRFRNPRFAVSISSPYYWDIVYGLNSWEWNIYVDDFYAYAFPTFSNPLWWDWRYGASYNSWGWPYYGWGWPYHSWAWSGWYGPYWGLSWGGWYGGWTWGHHHHYEAGWHGGGWVDHHRNTYTDRRSIAGGRRYSSGTSTRRTSGYSRGGASARRGGTSARTRTGTTRSSIGRTVTGSRNSSARVRTTGTSVRRAGGSSSRTSVSRYTRPSDARPAYRSTQGVRQTPSSYSRSGSTYRGSTLPDFGRSSGSMRSTTRSGSFRSNAGQSRSTFSTPSSRTGGSRSTFSGGSSGGSRSSGVRSSGGGSRSGGSSRRR